MDSGEFSLFVAGAIGLLFICAIVSWINALGRAMRRKRLARRPRTSIEHWFDNTFPAQNHQRLLVLRICQEIANELGIEITQLRIDDRFDHELSAGRWRVGGQEFEIAGRGIDKFFEEYGIGVNTKHIIARVPTLGELIEQMSDLLETKTALASFRMG